MLLGEDILGWQGTLWRKKHSYSKNIKGTYFSSFIVPHVKVQKTKLKPELYKFGRLSTFHWKRVIIQTHLKKMPLGVPWWHSSLKFWHCYYSGLGCHAVHVQFLAQYLLPAAGVAKK